MKEYKAMAHINSLKGEMAEITVLEKVGDNDYIVDYKGVKCHALLIGLFVSFTPTTFTGELNNEIHFLSLQSVRHARFRLLRRRNARYAIVCILFAQTGCKQIQTRQRLAV